jgi:hypothetical protein
MDGCLLTFSAGEAQAALNAQAETYLQELRAATAEAQDRLRAGLLRLQPQAAADDFVEQQPDDRFPPELDPIFATREFDVPPQAVGGLVSFDSEEDFSFDR